MSITKPPLEPVFTVSLTLICHFPFHFPNPKNQVINTIDDVTNRANRLLGKSMMKRPKAPFTGIIHINRFMTVMQDY